MEYIAMGKVPPGFRIVETPPMYLPINTQYIDEIIDQDGNLINFREELVTDHVYVGNSIVNAEYHTHQPYASTRLNNNDEIRIPIQTQNVYTLPSKVFYILKEKLLDEANQPSTT
ncbi:hypothetical protein NQ318_023214 [Aromia moschata]|uniref:Uncharacterized protein n=1 Tax=Aromia moschata TaxID=1265417 RepID=A0AAV8XLT4_9CUCU|nr:hypothetical protein NQ318_023214 [Aromia moschata]